MVKQNTGCLNIVLDIKQGYKNYQQPELPGDLRSDPDLFFNLIPGPNRMIFFQIKIQPEPDPDFFVN